MNLSEVLSDFYGSDNVNIVDGNPNVYKCVRRVNNDTPFQITYVDNSDAWLEMAFNSDLNNFLVKDYYASPGPIQWNIYYYFISSVEVIASNLERKKQIENDESYARKLVMSPDGFNSLLSSIKTVGDIGSNELSSDLFSIWVDRLTEGGLPFVFDDANYPDYTSWVNAYIDGETFETPADAVSMAGRAVEDIEFLKELRIRSFRKQPEGEEFKFGKINLLHGPNASGKTSLLETIELIVTGEGGSGSSNTYDLELINTAGVSFTFPTDPSIYKRRDIAWYKSSMTRGHNLNGNFNRFNYYASDAAYKLKMSNERGDYNLEQIISNIALGREVNRLEERIIGFLNRFSTAGANLGNEELVLIEELAQKREKLYSIQNSRNNVDEYKKPLLEKLRLISWKKIDFIELSQGEIIELEKDIQFVETCVTSILNDQLNRTFSNYKSIQSEFEVLEDKFKKLTQVKEEISRLTRARIDETSKLTECSSVLAALQEVYRILNHINYGNLKGLSQRLNEQKAELDAKTNIYNQIADINNSIFKEFSFSEDRKLSELEREIYTRKNDFAEQLATVKKDKEEMERGVEELTRILASIKANGIRFLEIDNAGEYCPLCNTEFKPNQLAEAISVTRDTFSTSGVLSNINKKLAEVEMLINENTVLAELFEKVRKAAILLFPDEWRNTSPQEVFNAIVSLGTDIAVLKNSYLELNAVKFSLANDKITEALFEDLQTRLFNTLKVEINDVVTCERYSNEMSSEVDQVNSRIGQIERELLIQNKSQGEIFDASYSDESRIASRLASLRGLDVHYTHLLQYIQLSDEITPEVIQNELPALRSVFDLYKRVYKEVNDQSQTIEYINSDIAQVNLKVEAKQEQRKRAGIAKHALEGLLSEYNKSEFIRDYIELNKKEISNIFRLIHSPVEFSDIAEVDGKLKLKHLTDGHKSLDEISTGQRSAFALSIFLALNKQLKGGPKIILFDDPVTYVDDVNSLSFLDFLRELALKSDRQIFFATANADLAFLFKKKFQFLGTEDFKDIPLQRSS